MLVATQVSNYLLMMQTFSLKGTTNLNIPLKLVCAANKLSLSPDKTCYSIFGNCSCNIKLLLNSKEIEKIESVKYLGLLTDDKLKWINHINNVYNKIIKYVGIFYI